MAVTEPADADVLAAAHELAAKPERQGARAYVVGAGGSSPVGCLGYVVCAAEIVAQESQLGKRFSRIIVPNGSSGTHAGLAAGFAAMGCDPSRVQSFTVLAPVEQARAKTLELAQGTLALLGHDVLPGALRIESDQRGEGYGIPTDAMFEAVRLLAQTEGLLLDPVYGGKAFAGLLAAMRFGEWTKDDAVLFIMTGGTPGLFACEPAFRRATAT